MMFQTILTGINNNVEFRYDSDKSIDYRSNITIRNYLMYDNRILKIVVFLWSHKGNIYSKPVI